MRMRFACAALLLPVACAIAPGNPPLPAEAPAAKTEPEPRQLTEPPVPVSPLPDLTTRPIEVADLAPYPRDWIDANRATLPSATFQTVVTGTVRDARSNEPVAGVRVYAVSLDGFAPVYPSMHYHRGTLTDALMHPANPIGETVSAADGTYTLELTVTGTGRIALQRLLRWLRPEHEGAPEKIAATFVVHADVPGAQSRGTVCYASRTPDWKVHPHPTDVLVDTAPWVTGRVVMGDPAAPVAGATIYVEDAADFRFKTRSGSDGEFRFPAHPGAGRIQVSVVHDFGWTRVAYETPDGPPADKDLGDVELLYGLRETAVVEGRLVSDDPATDPSMYLIDLVGRTISEYDKATRRREDTRVLSDGRFRIRWNQPDTCRLLLRYSPGGSQITEEFEVRPGTVVNVGTIRMLTPKTVAVRVADTAGTPIRDAAVSVNVATPDGLDPTRFFAPEDTGGTAQLGSGTTDESGRFQKALPAEQLLYLSASHPEFLASRKTVHPGDAAEPTVVLSRGATIRGSVKRDGAPLKERAVCLERQETPADLQFEYDSRFRHSPTDGWQIAFAYTDEDGKFSLNRLPPGTYKVSYCQSERREVVPRHLWATFESTLETALIVAGEHAYDVAFDLPGDVTPSVAVKLNGNPCAGARAWLEPEDGHVYEILYSLYDPDRKPPTTDDRGRITLPSLPEGRYRLVVEAPVGESLIIYRQEVALSQGSHDFAVNLNPANHEPG